MITRARSLLSVAALALLATSCLNDPAEPEIIIDPVDPVAFEAVSANGRQLPTFLGADGSARPRRQLTRASTLLLPPNSLRLILTTRHVAENGDAGAAIRDTVWASVQFQDSTLVLSRLGANPMLLEEQATASGDRTLLLTVEQPLPSSDGVAGAYPLELRLEWTDFRGLEQH